MTRPASKRKPTSAEETARVLRIMDMLVEELDRRHPPVAVISREPLAVTGPAWDLLTVADRIASRTEDV